MSDSKKLKGVRRLWTGSAIHLTFDFEGDRSHGIELTPGMDPAEVSRKLVVIAHGIFNDKELK